MHSDIHKRHGKVTSSILKAEKGAKNKALKAKLEERRERGRKESEEELSGKRIFK